MKNKILLIATLFGLSITFASCQKGIHSAEVTPVDPTVDPWEGYEKTADGTRIILPEPITLDISVAPTRSTSEILRAAKGDFDGIYSDDERARATVNTPEPDEPTRPTMPYRPGTVEYGQWYYSDEYRAYQRAFDRWQSWNTNGGEDWIRDLHIPELQEGDYVVKGLVPYSDFGRYSTGIDVSPYSKVTITFYKLPTSGVLSFMVNSKAYHTNDDKKVESLAPLTLENPFLITENPDFCYEQDVVSKRKWNDWKDIFPGSDLGGGSQLFDSFYLPMFSRLVDVVPNGKKGINGRESGSTDPVHEIKSIYLERAVAKVTVRWEYEYYPAGSTTKVKPVDDHFFDDIYPGQYPNITSVVPNNWTALKTHYEKVGKPAANMPFYRNYPNIAHTENEPVSTALGKGGTEHFYMPENFPTNASEQSTMLVYITKFDPATKEIVGKRRYKVFELPLGTKRADGLREVRRNHSYEILLRFKKASPGTDQPIEVGTWEDQEVDIPW